MKALKLIVFVLAMFVAGTTKAQVTVTMNLGSPPMWGPVGYSGVRYYYLPDVEAYYDVSASMFIYQSGGVWIHRTYLPRRYRNYDLYNGYKVVMSDYNGNTPYTHFREHQRDYRRGYHGPAQHNIGERPGNGNPKGHIQRQHVSPKAPANRSVKREGNYKNQGKDNNRGNGHGKRK